MVAPETFLRAGGFRARGDFGRTAPEEISNFWKGARERKERRAQIVKAMEV